MLSNSLTCTTEMLSWVVDSTRSTLLFPVTACSTFRVTNCSTLSAEIPGHGVIASAMRTGMSGSLRLGMFMYPNTPQARVANNATQAICRFLTKNCATLRLLLGFSAFIEGPLHAGRSEESRVGEGCG